MYAILIQLDSTPDTLPLLGVHYSQQWAAEDAKYQQLFQDGDAPIPPMKEYAEIESIVFDGSVQLCPLTQRIISSYQPCLVPDIKDTVNDGGKKWTSQPRSVEDLLHAEERLKMELEHVGLYKAEQSREPDDEVAMELAQKIAQLNSLKSTNAPRKATLLDRATKYIAFQEYSSVLRDINKNIEAGHIKRIVIFK